MGRTSTLALVREEIRVRYDLPSAFSSTTFVTTTAVNAMINSSLQAYYGLLQEMYGDNYFATSTTITTTPSTATTALPSRFNKLLALHWTRGTNDVVKLRPANVDALSRYGMGATSWNEYTPCYRITGTSNIEWFPTPSAAYSVRCDYVALPADLSADGDPFEAGNGWEEWVVLDVCRKIAGKEQVDAGPWLRERDDFERRIRAQAPDRDEGEPLTLRDVTRSSESAYERRNRLTNEW